MQSKDIQEHRAQQHCLRRTLLYRISKLLSKWSEWPRNSGNRRDERKREPRKNAEMKNRSQKREGSVTFATNEFLRRGIFKLKLVRVERESYFLLN